MPNKTIYVSDGDVRLFERAQELNGGNLSAAIADALHRFVAIKEANMDGYEEVTVRVGRGGVRRHKRFLGRRIARWHHRGADRRQHEVYTVYHTRKGRYAVHHEVRGPVDWRDPETWLNPETWLDPESWTGHRFRIAGDWFGSGDCTLDVYDAEDDLAANVPPELADIVRENEREPEVETLDI